MEKNVTEVHSENLRNRTYFPSFNIIRVGCVIAIAIASFGLPIPYFAYVQPLFNCATGILFTIYGYLVLRSDRDLMISIKHTAKVFAIMFVVYLLLTMGYLQLMYGKPFAYFTKRGIFNFLVLNYWNAPIGNTIWYVQATLYSLIVFKLLKKFKKYDWAVCIALFVLSVIIGELAKVVNFSFLGNQYIPGNFLTRTMPYMLLGRLIHNYYPYIRQRFRVNSFVLIFIGLIFSVTEFTLLYITGNLIYTNHLIGFIVISAGVCIFGVNINDGKAMIKLDKYATPLYKGMYYIFNPLGYFISIFLAIIGNVICKSQAQYDALNSLTGVFTILISFCSVLIYAIIKNKIKLKASAKKDVSDNFEYDEEDDD